MQILNRETIDLAISAFGNQVQYSKVIEECAELIDAISKWRDGRVGPEKVADEAADVFVMIEQVRVMIGESLFDSALRNKVERLKRRINPGTSEVVL